MFKKFKIPIFHYSVGSLMANLTLRDEIGGYSGCDLAILRGILWSRILYFVDVNIKLN
jgi:hypothetical protein